MIVEFTSINKLIDLYTTALKIAMILNSKY